MLNINNIYIYIYIFIFRLCRELVDSDFQCYYHLASSDCHSAKVWWPLQEQKVGCVSVLLISFLININKKK